MKYDKINHLDIANGPNCRVSIFFTGCNHKCKGCFNYELWDFKYGKIFNDEAKNELFDALNKPFINGRLSILGGEPLQQNLCELKELLIDVKKNFPNGDIWLWTGYYLSELNEEQKEIISLCDYVVDGRFDIDKKDVKLRFKGSTNQTVWKNENGEWVVSEYNL